MRWRQGLAAGLMVGVLLSLAMVGWAADPSYEKTNACRNNLKNLKGALEKALKARSDLELPKWGPMEDVFNLALAGTHLPQKPVGPTLDCRYFLVCKNRQTWDWLCDLHGTLDGGESLTFRYHEFQFTAKVNRQYEDVVQYKQHLERMRSWLSYSPSVMESLKFRYQQNPTTAVILAVLGVVVILFIYRNVFE